MARSYTIEPAPLPASLHAELAPALASEHAAEPFGPLDVRSAARRVVAVADRLGVRAVILRGSVDLGGAELDHVFVVVADRVVDVALPVRDEGFVRAVRAWVAGDLELPELDDRATGHGLDERVLGEYPDALRYRGAPLWGTAA